jgi:hypothetical protein
MSTSRSSVRLQLPNDLADELEQAGLVLPVSARSSAAQVASSALEVLGVAANVIGVLQAPSVLPDLVRRLRTYGQRTPTGCVIRAAGPGGVVHLNLADPTIADVDAIASQLASIWGVPFKSGNRQSLH